MATTVAPPANLADTARIARADDRYQKLLKLRALRQELEFLARLSSIEATCARALTKRAIARLEDELAR